MRIIENRGSSEPKQYDFKLNSGLRQLMINVDIKREASDVTNEEGEQYTWNTILFAPGEYEYDSIVDALIRYKYPQANMESIINNYLAEPDNKKYASEFKEMQGYRIETKSLAKAILSMLGK